MNSLDQSLSFPQYYASSNIASRQMSGLLFASFCFATIWAPPGAVVVGETITVYLSQNKAFTFMLSDAKPHQLYFLINRVSQKNVWKYIHNIPYNESIQSTTVRPYIPWNSNLTLRELCFIEQVFVSSSVKIFFSISHFFSFLALIMKITIFIAHRKSNKNPTMELA